MESDKKEKYINWLLEEFNIELNEKNKKYFYEAVDINITYGLYSSRVLAFRGDALITFLVCDRNIIKVNADYDGKLTELQNKKQKLIGETFLLKFLNITICHVSQTIMNQILWEKSKNFMCRSFYLCCL